MGHPASFSALCKAQNLYRDSDTTEEAAKKVGEQIPRRLKSPRDDKNKTTWTAQLKLRPSGNPLRPPETRCAPPETRCALRKPAAPLRKPDAPLRKPAGSEFFCGL